MAIATSADLQEIREALSIPRVGTYDAAVSTGPAGAVELYVWNAKVAAAFFVPLHIVEVVTRNAVAEVLEEAFEHDWHKSDGLLFSLPDTQGAYSARRDLDHNRKYWNPTTRRREFHETPGKVIPELKFVFWEKLLTARFDDRLWNDYIHDAFPNSSYSRVPSLRRRVATDLERIRRLRNRIAHHEPIFSRDLAADLATMVDLVRLRSDSSADWLLHHEAVTDLLNQRP